MHYIGVAGQAQQGKDTLADYLAFKLNEERLERRRREQLLSTKCSLNLDGKSVFWERSAFARAVKQIYCETFDKDLDFVEFWKTNPEIPPGMDMTVRKALQLIGDGFRQIQRNIWIDLMFRDTSRPKIISDARYVNELTAIHEHGGFNVLVVHPDRINEDSNGSEAQMRPFARYALGSVGWSRRSKMENPTSDDKSPYADAERPEGWELVHWVIINDGTVEDLYRKADTLIPMIHNFFESKERISA